MDHEQLGVGGETLSLARALALPLHIAWAHLHEFRGGRGRHEQLGVGGEPRALRLRAHRCEVLRRPLVPQLLRRLRRLLLRPRGRHRRGHRAVHPTPARRCTPGRVCVQPGEARGEATVLARTRR